MGNFFRPRDDLLNQRIVLTRQSSVTIDSIWLDVDPSGVGVTPFSMPDVVMKTFLSSVPNAAGFYIAYLNALVFKTNLPAAKSVAVGTDLTLTIAIQGGSTPYAYQWYYGEIAIDPAINPSAAMASLINHAVTIESSGSYWCQVTDASGRVIDSVRCAVTVS
jgi:hypothetical protein